MTLFFNRQNEPVEDVIPWARLYEDVEYRNVAVDVEGNMMVSTIWEGFDTRPSFYVPEYPRIFETAVLRDGHIFDHDLTTRWHTEAEAIEGHDALCRHHLGRPADPTSGVRETIVERYNAERE